MKIFMERWLLPLISFVIGGGLFALYLVSIGESNGFTWLITVYSAIMAHTFMVVGLFIASRPRFLEKHIGMPKMYETHAVMTLLACLIILFHIIHFWSGVGAMFRSLTTIFGYLAFICMLCGLLSGMLSLSGMFIQKFPALLKIKEGLNREVMLWVHRITGIGAIVFAYLQQFFTFTRFIQPYFTALTIVTFGTIAYYLIWKLSIAMSSKFEVVRIEKETPTLWALELKPINGKLPTYRPGDYFSIYLKDVDGVGSEAHPFSVSSAITEEFPDRVQFMIKESGDWSGSLDKVRVGDQAKLDGPYGDYYQPAIEASDKPFVLLAGGIGLTPNLAIIRHEIEENTQRRIHLIWALSLKEDTFMLDELEAFKRDNPNFDYDLIYSVDEVENYDHGFISDKFLEKIGVHELYGDAEFFICGPGVMINATKNLLLNNEVDQERIHIDEFDF